MRLIDKFSSKSELEGFLKHVGEVRKADSQGLRRGNLEKHVARLLGVADWNTALGMMSNAEPAKCELCDYPFLPSSFRSSEIVFCSNTRCINHIVCVDDTDGDEFHRKPVFASFVSDDDRYEVSRFDASPYFEHLKDKDADIAAQQLEYLLLSQGSGCEASDDVARSFSDTPDLMHYASLPGYSTIFAHFQRPDGTIADTGFKVDVNCQMLIDWLRQENPATLNALSSEALAMYDD